MEKVKRKSVYIYSPQYYGLKPTKCPYCGSEDITWSEFVGELACNKCQKDFPGEEWAFDITPIHTSAILGFRFDTVNLTTNEISTSPCLPLPDEPKWNEYKEKGSQIIGYGVKERFEYIENIWKSIRENNIIVNKYKEGKE